MFDMYFHTVCKIFVSAVYNVIVSERDFTLTLFLTACEL